MTQMMQMQMMQMRTSRYDELEMCYQYENEFQFKQRKKAKVRKSRLTACFGCLFRMSNWRRRGCRDDGDDARPGDAYVKCESQINQQNNQQPLDKEPPKLNGCCCGFLCHLCEPCRRRAGCRNNDDATGNDINPAPKLVAQLSNAAIGEHSTESSSSVPDVTWDDVPVSSRVRKALESAILMPMRHVSVLKTAGTTTHCSILLCGPPGCGKTLVAKALANEACVNFISVNGVELMYRYFKEQDYDAVRSVFERARKSAPCVLFIDQLDMVCPRRDTIGANLVTQMALEMEEHRPGVFLVAATSRPEVVDPDILRSGRIVYVGLPKTADDRADILRALTKNGTKPKLAPDVELHRIAADPRTDGYTVADLRSLVKASAELALEEFLNRNPSDAADIAAGSWCVREQHFETIMSTMPPSLTTADRKRYDNMARRYDKQGLNRKMTFPFDKMKTLDPMRVEQMLQALHHKGIVSP